MLPILFFFFVATNASPIFAAPTQVAFPNPGSTNPALPQ